MNFIFCGLINKVFVENYAHTLIYWGDSTQTSE